MMGQQPQQMVGIHHHHHLHHHESEQQPIVVDQQHKQHHHHHHQHHHHHHQLMEEESGQAGGGGGEGLPEDEEDVEEDPEDDDPAELAAAVPSSGAIGEGMAPGNADAANLVPVLGVDSSRRQHQRPRGGGGSGGGGGGGGISSSSSGSGGAATAVVVAAAAAAAGLQMPVLPVPCCRVDGCGEDLSTAGDYHRRHKVCKLHATLPKVMNHGQEQRFCQQCSRFHSLSEFDEGKRSCRKRLAGHNERRRRHQPDSLATTSSESPPLTQGRESNKKPREWKGRGRGGRRGRSGLSFSARGPGDDPSSPLVLRDEIQSMSSKRRAVKSGEESFSIIFNDAFPERDSVKGKMSLRVADMMEKRVAGEYKEIDELDIDIADMEQVKEGLDLGEGVVIPPLPLKRDGKLSVLKGWPPQEGGVLNPDEMQIETSLTPKDELENKRAWQRDDKETLLHCFWECSKVQPVWRWAARQLSKLRGSKVKLELRQAVFGGKLDSWASQENVSVWKLLRGIILWQIWLARKGKALSGIQWTSNKVIRAAWVDLMMYAMQDWLEVYKKKETGKMEDAHELRGKFDSKWLVNQFAGKRAEWSMVWKDPDDVLLD